VIMRVDLHGLTFEVPKVLFYLWSPWRCLELEHRLFDAVRKVAGIRLEENGDEKRLIAEDERQWKAAHQALVRVLKGWQEDPPPGAERRQWCWIMEGDVNAAGYDVTGQPACVWVLVKTLVERGGPHDGEKGEELDLEGFGIQLPGNG